MVFGNDFTFAFRQNKERRQRFFFGKCTRNFPIKKIAVAFCNLVVGKAVIEEGYQHFVRSVAHRDVIYRYFAEIRCKLFRYLSFKNANLFVFYLAYFFWTGVINVISRIKTDKILGGENSQFMIH